MRRTLTKAALILLVLTLLLSGCSQDYKVEGGPSADAEVSYNGGLAVKKGDYLFFINGISTISADNNYGTPVKGSIVRMNLSDPDDKVIVVPKVVLSSYGYGGFYIFGGKIYYTSPSIEKDKDGHRLSTYLDYFSVNLDGSGNKKIMHTISNSFAYKFFEHNNKVYIVYIDSTNQKVYNVDAESGARKVILDGYTGTPILGDDNYVYYTEAVYKDEDLKTTYTYNKFKRVSFTGGTAEDIKFSGGETIAADKYSITLSDVKVFEGETTVYYTKKSGTDKPEFIDLPEPHLFSFTIGEATDKKLLASSSTNSFDFTERYYLSPTSFFGVYGGNIWYVQANHGEDPHDPTLPTLNAVELMPKPSKILEVEGDDFYYLDSSNKLFKKQFKGDGVVPSKPGDEVYKDIGFDTSKLSPEFIGGYVYFFSSGGDYSGYTYRYKLDGTEEEAQLISIIADEDKKEE